MPTEWQVRECHVENEEERGQLVWARRSDESMAKKMYDIKMRGKSTQYTVSKLEESHV